MLLQGPSHLSHEVLCTLMAEVTAIINARPLVSVSVDPDFPLILTPAMLLAQKDGRSPAPPGDFNDKDLFRSQWRQVQSLASKYWSRWRNEYLPTLQSRRKWNEARRNLQKGDLVLLKDCQVPRNEWPMALIHSVIPGKDWKVRKVELKTSRVTILSHVRRGSSKAILCLCASRSIAFSLLYHFYIESSINLELEGYFPTLVSSVMGVWLAV
ncbi:hypothetical protein DPEC_G00036510 [Dallia pectoralis]|uniref:Uncharacterized protein n=1 Tax=Dallia pectoralis TaxID=75939 RepID=A0ACC2HE22_DALPE|nr:hypothetical protein DPEC_G00036510 [Dallia pectoralis]